MKALQKERWLYLALALAISACVYWGFSYTYFSGEAPGGSEGSGLPAAVHVHGISFLAWYALLALQAGLIMLTALRLHRMLGLLSLALVCVMVASGLLVVAVRMDGGLNQGDRFWAAFSLPVLSTLILFTAYYALAIRARGKPAAHRRYIIVAAVTGSGAAAFRILAALAGPSFYTVPMAILATNLFLVVAAIADKLVCGKTSRIYLWAIPIAVLFEGAMQGLAFTGAGVALQRTMIAAMRPLFSLY